MKAWFYILFFLAAGAGLRSQNTSPDSLYARAARNLEQHRIDSCLNQFEYLATHYPSFEKIVDVNLILGRLYTDYLRKYALAIEIYKKTIRDYPGNDQTAHAYFMLGYVFANYVGDYRKARLYLVEFLRKYPQHKLSASAEFELTHLGKQPEEFFEPDTTDTTK